MSGTNIFTAIKQSLSSVLNVGNSVGPYEIDNKKQSSNLWINNSYTGTLENGGIDTPFKTINAALLVAHSFITDPDNQITLMITSGKYNEDIIITKRYINVTAQTTGNNRRVVVRKLSINLIATDDNMFKNGISVSNMSFIVRSEFTGINAQELFLDNCSFDDGFVIDNNHVAATGGKSRVVAFNTSFSQGGGGLSSLVIDNGKFSGNTLTVIASLNNTMEILNGGTFNVWNFESNGTILIDNSVCDFKNSKFIESSTSPIIIENNGIANFDDVTISTGLGVDTITSSTNGIVNLFDIKYLGLSTLINANISVVRLPMGGDIIYEPSTVSDWSNIPSRVSVALDELASLSTINSNIYKFIEGTLSRAGQTTIPLMNQQLGVWEKYLTLVYTPVVTENYQLSLSFIWSLNAISNNFWGKIVLNDGINPDIELLFVVEPKDSGGTGEVINILQGGSIVGSANTGTDIRHPESFLFDKVLTGGTNYTITFEFGSDVANLEATIYQAQLRIEKKLITP